MKKLISIMLVIAFSLLTVSCQANKPNNDVAGIKSKIESDSTQDVQSDDSQVSGSENVGEYNFSGEQVSNFNNEFWGYVKSADTKMFDYLFFEDEKAGADLKKALTFEKGKQVWKLMLEKATLYLTNVKDQKFKIDSEGEVCAEVCLEYQQWIFFDFYRTVFDFENNGKQLGNVDDVIKMFTKLKDVVPTTAESSPWYLWCIEGQLKISGEEFFDSIVGPNYVEKIVSDDENKLFTGRMRDRDSYDKDLSRISEEGKQVAHYVELLANYKYLEAYDYIVSCKGDTWFYDDSRKTLEKYRALSADDKAKIDEQIKKIPKANYKLYATIGGGNEIYFNSIIIVREPNYHVSERISDGNTIKYDAVPNCIDKFQDCNGNELIGLSKIMYKLFP
ncbi:MAG: hypothetical protein WAX04_07650 [Oscillospiraceae bacterium]